MKQCNTEHFAVFIFVKCDIRVMMNDSCCCYHILVCSKFYTLRDFLCLVEFFGFVVINKVAR